MKLLCLLWGCVWRAECLATHGYKCLRCGGLAGRRNTPRLIIMAGGSGGGNGVDGGGSGGSGKRLAASV